jgi:hypothetical protein
MNQLDNYNNFYNNLLPRQRDAVTKAFNLLMRKKKKVLFELATNSGKTLILVALIKRFFDSNRIHRVLILSVSPLVLGHFSKKLREVTQYSISEKLDIEECQITLLTYAKLQSQATLKEIQKFDLIICNEVQHTKNEKIIDLFQNTNSIFFGILSDNFTNNYGWFNGEKISYNYSYSDIIKDRYIESAKDQVSEKAILIFCSKLFQQLGYEVNIEPKVDIINPDLLLKKNEKKTIVEIKMYKNRFISRNVIEIAVEQILKYKRSFENKPAYKNFEYYLILFCEFNHQQKKQIFEQYGITIWDISNMLYICSGNTEFSKELTKLLYYPISEIMPNKPLDKDIKLPPSVETFEFSEQKIFESLVERLANCNLGKEEKAAQEYENICTDIINFLFGSEFTQISKQHNTGDDMFRMDLLCGIKGSSEFWELLRQHYNTRFVVFEFKNYKEPLQQNLIFVTEKYLFNAALRNVAIIISRKGFSKTALNAALGILKEDGKLVIDLTDDDLLKMLHKKIDGEEPSEYLLDKLEILLMSVSK